MKMAVQRSLSVRFIRSALLCALIIGLLLSAAQISIDYVTARKQPDVEMETLIGILKEPATAIVFSLDPVTANELLNGTLRHPAVVSIRMMLPDNQVFAERHRSLVAARDRFISDLLFGRTRHYNWNLTTIFPTGTELLGALEVTLDMHHYGGEFLGRASIVLGSTLIYTLLVSAGVLVLFHFLVNRPMVSVIGSIVEVDMVSPEKARLIEPAGHANDEIGLLVAVTNKHLQTIDASLCQVRHAEELLKRHSDSLESIVAERTQALSDSLAELQAAQNQLIESEKLAALGGLVAGVAHEVNTPLGIAITASSLQGDALRDLRAGYQSRALSSERFEELLGILEEGHGMLDKNLDRAARLVRDFKRTAVDQVSEARCDFTVRGMMDALITSLHPETVKRKVVPRIDCPGDLRMRSLPGVLSQIMTNLILNSVRHGFDAVENPEIDIVVRDADERVILEYRDNGVGVPRELHERIFEPFFTTKRGHGGSGLGLNIVYNLITRKLGGHLTFSSEPGHGVKFVIDLPKILRVPEDRKTCA